VHAHAELADWIRLAETPGVGPDTARKLLAAFGLPEHIFSVTQAALCEVVSTRVAVALLTQPSAQLLALIERTVAWADIADNFVLTLADQSYPPRLLEISDPPILIYAKGRIELLTAASVAIVGSRNATAQGLENAQQFAATLTEAGLSIISGMALGIDTAAHRGSLSRAASSTDDARGASTVAVIGTGADIVYPARNRSLAHDIASLGCIVSEYSLGMPAIATNFPRRNRIISGLSRGVLVIEAAAQSGSLITARLAAEQGRDVFAIPGSIHSPLAKGCHQLIKQGAKLVESAQDILDEINVLNPSHTDQLFAPTEKPLYRPRQSPSLPVPAVESSDPILQAMGFEPVVHDVLAQRCGLESADLSSKLLTLELKGLIELLPGGAYQRVR
jgi:DNA processing protein